MNEHGPERHAGTCPHCTSVVTSCPQEPRGDGPYPRSHAGCVCGKHGRRVQWAALALPLTRPDREPCSPALPRREVALWQLPTRGDPLGEAGLPRPSALQRGPGPAASSLRRRAPPLRREVRRTAGRRGPYQCRARGRGGLLRARGRQELRAQPAFSRGREAVVRGLGTVQQRGLKTLLN